LPDLALADAPLTWQPMPESPHYASDNRLLGGRHELGRDVRAVMPAIVLTLHFPGGEQERWLPVPNLLDSGPFDQHFVAEIDNAGAAELRFGDDQYGRRPLGAEAVTASLRIGNGRPGNIGAGALVHIVQPSAAELTDPANPAAGPASFAAVARVYQPLAARLGTDPESIEEVRQLAPEAFRAVQFRAVTEADWQEVAQRHPGVAASRVRFRWTGSWHTVFVAIHPRDTADLVRLPGGGAALAPDFAAAMGKFLERFKLAGYDLAVRAAHYVPLELNIQICVAAGHFRGDVLEAVAHVLCNRVHAGARGFFHPLEFNFGESVYLSRVYAAVEAVEGVEAANVSVFKRYWQRQQGELQRGLIEIGAMEIARLDNDANFPENGALKLTAIGGL
jgi:predicted phage baseplate assembly protein